MWTIFKVGQNNPISLRAIWPKDTGPPKLAINQTYCAQRYPDLNDRQEAFVADAVRLNDDGYNVYIVMNPINSGFRAGSVSGQDIECRRLLLIDIDRKAGTRQPATEQELEEALCLSDKIEAYLLESGWVDIAKVMSGNGAHLYCPLDDLPNDQNAKDAVQSVLRDLARKFDTDMLQIDQMVFDAPRITKVPGTIARKGTESPSRPYRMARVL
jgi:hypothetical protein